MKSEKETYKKNAAASNAMLVNKYEDTVFGLSDADNNTRYVRKNEI